MVAALPGGVEGGEGEGGARTPMKKIKAAVVAAAVLAGIAVTAAPANAVNHCKRAGATYICQYGVSVYTFPDGTKQEFLVGPDAAVWTRWNNTKGKWNHWSSMGGKAFGPIRFGHRWGGSDRWAFDIVALHSDGAYRVNIRNHDGQWSGWMPVPDPT